MSNLNQMAMQGASDFAKNNPDMVKEAGQAIGQAAYDNREVIAEQAYQHREEIAQAAYDNPDLAQNVAGGFVNAHQQQQQQPDQSYQQNTSSAPVQQPPPSQGAGAAIGGGAGGGAGGSKKFQMPRPPKEGIQSKILTTCQGNTLIGANVSALGLCAAGCIIRFAYMFGGTEPKPKDYNSVIFFLTTVFFIVFIAITGLSLLQVDNKAGLFVRSNFHFLDYYLGRGLFLLFIGLFLLELAEAMEYIFFAVVAGVAIVDCVVGWHEVNVRKAASEAAGEARGAVGAAAGFAGGVNLGGGGGKSAPAESAPNPRAQQYQVEEPAQQPVGQQQQNIEMQQQPEQLDVKKEDSAVYDPYNDV